LAKDDRRKEHNRSEHDHRKPQQAPAGELLPVDLFHTLSGETNFAKASVCCTLGRFALMRHPDRLLEALLVFQHRFENIAFFLHPAQDVPDVEVAR